jgi:hypothetical protein
LRLPGDFFSGDGVEDDEELSGDGDEGELGRLAGLAQALVEGAQDGVEARAVHGREVERGADGGPAPADVAHPAQLPAVAGEGSDADQGGDLSASEVAELRQVDQQGARCAGSDARNRLEQAGELGALGGRRQLVSMSVAEKNRRETAAPAVRPSIAALLRVLA